MRGTPYVLAACLAAGLLEPARAADVPAAPASADAQSSAQPIRAGWDPKKVSVRKRTCSRSVASTLAEPGLRGEHLQSVQSLRQMAEQTGGFAAVDVNGVDGAFTRIMQDMSEYYVLAYAPAAAAKAGPANAGTLQRLEVTVTRPGVRVVARTAFAALGSAESGPSMDLAMDAPPAPGFGGRVTAPSPRGRTPLPEVTAIRRADLDTQLSALLASPLPRPDLPMSVQTIAFARGGRTASVTLVIEIAGHALLFAERGRRFEERVRLASLTIDAEGRAANGASATLDLRLTPEQFAGVQATGIRWLSHLELAPGRYQLKVAARSERSGRAGVVMHDIEVPRFDADRVALSGVTLTSLPSVLLVTRGEGALPGGLPSPPSAGRVLVAGDRLTALVQVYRPQILTADVEVSAVVEGRDGASALQTQERIAGTSRRPVEASFTFDTSALPPGRYLLRITASAGSPHPPVQRALPFEIVTPESRGRSGAR